MWKQIKTARKLVDKEEKHISTDEHSWIYLILFFIFILIIIAINYYNNIVDNKIDNMEDTNNKVIKSMEKERELRTVIDEELNKLKTDN